MSKKWALFLGCNIPVRAINYEMSIRQVSGALGIELTDIPDFTCCGHSAASVNQDAMIAISTYNLCKAEKADANIITGCTGCVQSLSKTIVAMGQENERSAMINEVIKAGGSEYKGEVEAKHFARVLIEDVGIEEISSKVVQNLEGFKFMPHYGCHYLKPASVYGDYDNPEDPDSLDRLINATGANSIKNPERLLCCGGPLLSIQEEIPMSMSKRILNAAKEYEADAIVTVCPTCTLMFDEYQGAIGDMDDTEYKIPILYISQLIGLALGLDPKALGLKKNVVKAKKLLAKIGGEE